jgi:peroxin-1
MVYVEPETEDDWEILELHSEYLEQQILNQICIVFNEEVFPLWINNQSVIKLKIRTILPKVSDSDCCFQLVQDSRIIVQPKVRNQSKKGTV